MDIVTSISVTLFIVIAVILLVLGNLFFWAGNTLVKQDRFVAVASLVIRDQQVRHTISLYATNQIFSNFDIQQNIAQTLPPRANFLAPQLTDQLRNATQRSLKHMLATPKFQDAWDTIIAKQHSRIIRFAEAYRGNDTVSLNDLYNRLTANLTNTKLTFLAGKQLPQNVGSYTLITVTATWLPALHDLITNIDTWRTLSILGLVLFVCLAVWLSRNKRRTLYAFGSFAVLGLAFTLLALRFARERYIDKIDPQYADGVARALQIVFHGFVVQTLTIMGTIILLTAITWISGSSRGAMGMKQRVRILFTEKLHALLFSSNNKFTGWMNRHRQFLEWSVVVLFIVIMLIVRLTPSVLIGGLLLMILTVLGIEVLSGHARLQTDGRPLEKP